MKLAFEANLSARAGSQPSRRRMVAAKVHASNACFPPAVAVLRRPRHASRRGSPVVGSQDDSGSKEQNISAPGSGRSERGEDSSVMRKFEVCSTWGGVAPGTHLLSSECALQVGEIEACTGSKKCGLRPRSGQE